MFAAGRPGANTIAKCYRLLHVIFETAVTDELVHRNPCRIKGGGIEVVEERPTASIREVFALAERVRPNRRGLVLLSGFSGLRLAELPAWPSRP